MKLGSNWRFKSLQDLEKISASDPPIWPSYLVKRSSKLIKTPLNEYTVEDLRLMIGQGVGLHYFVPLAIEKLDEDLFAEGDFYPGDLLSNILKIDAAFWMQYKFLYDQIIHLIANRDDEIKEAGISLEKFATDEKRY